MKKIVTLFLATVLLLSLLTYASADSRLLSLANNSSLPSIDSILLTDNTSGKVEVCDSLDGYDPFGEIINEYDKPFRVLTLEREAPQKKFTKKTEYPPFTNEGLGNDFTGEDIGRSRVWLRLDLMELLPPMNRATSWEDATYLLVVENAYYWDTQLSVTHYDHSADEVLPEFKDSEEIIQYFVMHPKKVISRDYYPTFGAYSLVTYYDKDTKASAWFNHSKTPTMRFAKNWEATTYWENMIKIEEILQTLKAETGIDRDSVIEQIQTIDFVPEKKQHLWVSCVENDEIQTAVYSISDFYWSMADELKLLDPSEENQRIYATIIEERNREALSQFVSYCAYNGFDRSISSIEKSKDYIAKPDMDLMEKEVIETIDYVFGNK